MKDTHLHILFSAVAVAMCLVGIGNTTQLINTTIIYGLVLINLILLIWDGIAFARGRTNLASTLLTFGVLFWFLIDAAAITLTDPPFSNTSRHFIYWGISYPDEEVALANLMIALFSLSMYLALAFAPLPSRTLNWAVDREPRMSGLAVDFALLILSLGYWVPIIIMFRGNLSTALHVMSEMRSATEGPTASAGLLLHLQWPGIFAGAVALVRLLSGASGNKVIQGAAVSLLMVGIFLSGTRYLIAYIMLPALIFLLLNWKQGNRRSRLIFFGFLAATFLLASIQGAIRSTGGLSAYIDPDSDVSLIDAGLATGVIGFGHYQPMLMAIDLIDKRGQTFDEYLLPLFVTFFVPREFWPDKPISEAWQYYNQMVTRGQAFNVTPSVIGQFYMTWGWWGGIVAGLVMGWLAKVGDYWWSHLSMHRNIAGVALGGLWFGFVFISFRFLWPLYFQYIVFAFIVYLMLTKPARALAARRPFGPPKEMAHAP